MNITTAERNSGISRKLIMAVVRQLGGREFLEDIRNHGMAGGFPGFTYYADTVSFFKRNRAEIVATVKHMASEFGEEPLTMVAGFGCLSPADEETKESICRCLYGGRLTDNDMTVANALAWFAGEEVARAFEPRD